MVELVQQQVTERHVTGSFADLLRKAKTGDCIHLCDHPFISGLQPHWCAHPEGVVVQQGDKLLLNGDGVLFKGVFRDWRIAVDDPNRIFLLNKKKGLGPEYSIISDHEGNEICRVESWWLKSWQAHSAGVVVGRGHHNQSDYTIELNAKKVLARMSGYGPCRWSVIPGTTDVLTQGGNRTFCRNGRLQKFDFGLADVEDWQISDKGFVFNEEDGTFSIIRWRKKKPVIYFDSQKQLAGCPDWRLHPNGIVLKSNPSSSKNRYTLIVVKE
jgi:hypothetical protein